MKLLIRIMLKDLLRILFIVFFCYLKSYSQPTNIDFSAGNLTGWSFTEAQNIDSYFMTNGAFSVSSKHALMMPGVLETNNVPVTMVSPLGGKFIRIGNTIDGGRSYKLSQTFNVNAASQALSVSYALITKFENNYCNDKPYFNFVLKDNLGNIIPSSNSYYTVSGSNCSSGDQSFVTSGNYDYKNWTTKNFSLQDYVGTNVTIEMVASGSADSLSTQPFYAYVDAAICSNSFSPNILTVNTNTYNLLQSQNSILVCGTNTANVIAPAGATSYSWTGAGITGATSQSVTINQAGKYQLIFNNPSACSNTTSVSFTLAPNPTISISGISNTVCAGNSFTMTASGAKNYTWNPFFNDTTGANTNFTSSHIVYPYTSSTYTVLANDTNGCFGTSQFSLTVIPKPILSVSGNTAICFGATSSLTAVGANSYTWTPVNSYNSTLTVTPSYNTTYTVIGIDSGSGCVADILVNVSVDRNIQDNYFTSNICIGDSISLTATGATTYTWSNGVMTNTVVLKPTSTTVYTLSGNSVCGLVQKTFTITVNPLPNVIANASNTLVCYGNSNKLYGSGAISYNWSNGISNNVFFNPTVTTTYTVVGTTGIGCKNSASITVSVNPTPTLNIMQTSSLLCLGQTATLSVSGANTYTWNNGQNTSGIVVTATNTGVFNYNVTGINSVGCSKNASVSVSCYSASPSFSFTSSTSTVCAVNSNTISFPSQSTYPYYVYSCSQPGTTCTINGLVLNPSPLLPTVYSVTATNGCGAVTQTIQVLPQSLPMMVLASPDSLCSGAAYSYSVSGADLYYLNGSGASAYSTVNTFTANAPVYPSQDYIAIDGKFFNGCKNDIGKPIKVLPNPSINISGSSTLTCSSCTTNLVASGGNTYSWNTGATTSNINVFPTSTAEYSVVGIDLNSCVSSAKTTIVVQDSLTLCFNSQLNLSGSNLKDLVSADFNGDGKMDIVTSNTTNIGLSIYVNNGSGGFLPPVNFGSFTGKFGLTASDVNNDGAPDIIVPKNTFYPDIISVYINDGLGNFIGPNNYNQNLGGLINIQSLTVADITGDGFSEIITGNFNGITVLHNSGSGTFSSNATNYNVNNISRYVYTADINNDSKFDIISMNGLDSTFVLINNGAGGFLPLQRYSSGRCGVICDITADGNLDIVTVKPNALSILVNNGSGAFNNPINQTVNLLSPYNVSSADFNNDGFEDLAVTNYSNTVVALEYIQVLVNLKNNSFHSPVNYYPSSTAAFLGIDVLTKDFNSDSRPDLATINAAKDSVLILFNSTIPSLTITPQTTSALCSGSSLTLTATGANTYTWSGGISNGVAFNPTQTQTYTVNATDVSGCSGYAVATVSISPNLSVISSSPNVCIGTSVSITATGADTYSWSTGAITTSVSVSPTTTTVYSVTGSDISTGCSYTQTVSLIADSCENVWPGDANSDGITDNLDVLELGLHFNQTGFARAIVSNAWQEFSAASWIGSISNGDNLSHSDCNGDGIINNNDTLAIFNNYGLTHAKSLETITVSPQITIVPDQAMVVKGNWGSASVYLGDAVNSINNINGVAFTIDFDNTLIEPSNIYIEYQNSFMDASQNLYFRKLDFVNGKIYTASTHTINNNVNGFGKIATLHYQILSTLTTDQVLNLGLLQANQSNVLGVITPLTSGSGTLMAVGASVGVSQINTEKLFTITPNPTNGLLTVISNDVMQSITVTNIAGQVLLLEQIAEKTHQLQLQNYADGIYFIKVVYANGMSVVKKVIKQ